MQKCRSVRVNFLINARIGLVKVSPILTLTKKGTKAYCEQAPMVHYVPVIVIFESEIMVIFEVISQSNLNLTVGLANSNLT